jgi:hypothetical protein
VAGEGAVMVGRDTEPVPTALPVDSSTTNCPHWAAGWDGTVPMDTGPVLPDPVGGVDRAFGATTAGPDDAAAPEDALPLALPVPVVPLCAGGTTIGCSQTAVCGHGVGPGTTPTGWQVGPCVHPPVVLLPDP